MGNLSTPNLRFPDFNGEWIKKKLGELSIINPTTFKLPDKFIYIDLESVTNGQLIKEEVVFKSKAPSRAQRVLERDDILFQMVRPYQKNNLYFDKNGDYVASTGYAQIKTKQSSRFLYQYLHLKKFVDEVIERCTGTSYPAINSKDLAKINIRYPSLPEQQKIASFFTAIDQKISQLKRKKNLLEQYKKGVMQKIFSQEIRFKDDNGQEFPNWEKKKLGELTYKTGKKNNDSTPFPIYSINNREGFLPQGDQFEGVDSNSRGYDISLYKIIEEKTFAYNPARINVGSIGFSGDLKNIIISSLYVCFKTKQGLEDAYLLHYLKTFQFNKSVLQNVEGGVRDYLFYENFSNIKINLPTNKEQLKIVSFLSAIDDKINHTQKQIEKAEVWKKGVMQQMFC